MLAVQLHSGEVSLTRVVVPIRPPGFALIRLRLAGICNTDLELQRGYYGFSGIPGHEFVGEVFEADNHALINKRVAGEINLACDHCRFCAVGLRRHCENRTVLGIVHHPGAFAEFLTLPEANLHVLPDEINDREAVFIEPLAAACEILDQVDIPKTSEVAVLGDGKLGLLIAMVLQNHGARVTVFGRHQAKLDIARQAGAVTVVSSELPKRHYRFVVEATGSPQAFQSAIDMAEPRGTVVLKSTVHGDVKFDSAAVIVNEIVLVGSRCGRFGPAIDLLRNRQVSVEEVISADYPLAEAPAAFAEAARRGVLKVLLRPS